MGKQDIYIRSKEITNHRIGNDGNDVKIFFNVPDEDEDEEYNDAILVEGNYSFGNPIANIDDAIKTLKEAKEKGVNFVAIWEHSDHQEIHIDGFKIEKLTDEEVVNYKLAKENRALKLENAREEKEREEYERLKNKFG